MKLLSYKKFDAALRKIPIKMTHYESRFLRDGLALAPDPPLVPFTPECRRALGVPPSMLARDCEESTLVGGEGPRGSRRAWADGGEWEAGPISRSPEYMRGGGPPFSALSAVCGDRLTVACTIGGDADAGYGRGG